MQQAGRGRRKVVLLATELMKPHLESDNFLPPSPDLPGFQMRETISFSRGKIETVYFQNAGFPGLAIFPAHVSTSHLDETKRVPQAHPFL